MLWPRRVWWLAGELPVSVARARCAGCSGQLISGAEAAACPPADAQAASGAVPPGARDATAAARPADDRSRHAAGGGLVVPSTGRPTFPYCSTCERQRDATRLGMALALAAGVICALGLPLLRLETGETGLAGHLLATLVAVALPLAGLSLPSSRLALGSPRVWPLGAAGVVVEGAALAAELGRAGVRCRAVWLPPLIYRPAVALVAIASLAVAALGYAWHHPRVWLLVLGGSPLTFVVDGASLARLEPVQPGVDQALSLRLASGVRHLSARDDAGRSVADVTATLSPGREHLFAPGGADECFWLERTGYGRDSTREAVPLRSDARFFTLDAGVDGWLSGSPPPSADDRRSSGGVLVLLRHSPCPRAPEPVRAASAARP